MSNFLKYENFFKKWANVPRSPLQPKLLGITWHWAGHTDDNIPLTQIHQAKNYSWSS